MCRWRSWWPRARRRRRPWPRRHGFKAEAQRAREKAEEEKWEKAKVAPEDLFRGAAAYQAWDADGLPTKLADGSDVPKTQQKRLKKEWDRQKKLHDAYVEKFGSK